MSWETKMGFSKCLFKKVLRQGKDLKRKITQTKISSRDEIILAEMGFHLGEYLII